MKASAKDFTLKFGEGLNMGEVVNTVGKVLVGRVKGRAYTAEHLNRWVKEIWGSTFKDLTEV